MYLHKKVAVAQNQLKDFAANEVAQQLVVQLCLMWSDQSATSVGETLSDLTLGPKKTSAEKWTAEDDDDDDDDDEPAVDMDELEDSEMLEDEVIFVKIIIFTFMNSACKSSTCKNCC